MPPAARPQGSPLDLGPSREIPARELAALPSPSMPGGAHGPRRLLLLQVVPAHEARAERAAGNPPPGRAAAHSRLKVRSPAAACRPRPRELSRERPAGEAQVLPSPGCRSPSMPRGPYGCLITTFLPPVIALDRRRDVHLRRCP